ncbi:hypothetical protein [Devosia sp. 2618]|uniref:hypothetical protein n=1 Tax=Devosia sp. 2618 TaxID=3156454 RepID=UPI003398E2D4
MKTTARTFLIALAGLGLAGSALAQTFPVPSVDPHASAWGVRGSFTLYYYGQLKDGTACPASPNALQYAIVEGDGELEYLHNYGLRPDVDPALAQAFEKGTFCSLAFDGEARFLFHHGKVATLAPTAVSPPEPTPWSATQFEGQIKIGYAPINCIQAPCIGGSYRFSIDGEQVGASGSLTVVNGAGGTPLVYNGEMPPFDTLSGTLRIDGFQAVITAR